MRTRLQHASEAGFTLIELLIVFVIVGILAGIALPTLRGVIFKADAAKIVSDMTTVRGALFQQLAAGSPFPEAADWGTAPPGLSLYLDGMTFQYKEVEYQFFSTPALRQAQFNVRYPEDSAIGAALQLYRRPGESAGSVTWTSTQTTFILYNDSPLVEGVAPTSDPAANQGNGKGKGKSEGKGKGKGLGTDR